MAISLPPNALLYLPVLEQIINDNWKELSLRSALCAQIEQETCISLKSKGCWNPKTELKTSREYGFGFGQITVSFNADGSERFNNFNEVKKLSAHLSSWKWEDRYDPKMQMEAFVLFDKKQYFGIKIPTKDVFQHLAFTFSAYNGGYGGVLQDRKLCQHTEGCDPTSWYASPNYKLGVKDVSFKSRVKATGYSISFYDVNRGYVDNVLSIRRPKYVSSCDLK